MWKKDEDEQLSPANQNPIQPIQGSKKSSLKGGGGPATIGPSITIKGDVTGKEDLVIQGRVEGTVKLSKHNITIGPDGRVKADVSGKMVIIEGEVEGDLRGQEQVVLRRSARVQGNIAAPRVALEDGAAFRGGIDMDASSVGQNDSVKGNANLPSQDLGSKKNNDSKPAGEKFGATKNSA